MSCRLTGRNLLNADMSFLMKEMFYKIPCFKKPQIRQIQHLVLFYGLSDDIFQSTFLSVALKDIQKCVSDQNRNNVETRCKYVNTVLLESL